jgi:hypothetical protein
MKKTIGEFNHMKCPLYGCKNFYIKDPEDDYETYAFESKNGEICFHENVDESDVPDIDDRTETFCDKCSWHGRYKMLKNI